jgi:hypothetical protein
MPNDTQDQISLDNFAFAGGAKNQTFRELTPGLWKNALRHAGWAESKKGQLFKCLTSGENASALRLETLGDFAQALKRGQSLPTGGNMMIRKCNAQGFWVYYRGNEFLRIKGRGLDMGEEVAEGEDEGS